MSPDELPRRRWTAESHDKLGRFLDTYGRRTTPELALFDADNTLWSGDLGDSTFVYLVRNAGLSPLLADVLPDHVDVHPVQAAKLGVPPGSRLFPKARVDAAIEAMGDAYQRVVDPTVPWNRLWLHFREALALPGGPLHGDATFMSAYRVYTGTLVALYALLEAQNGCLTYETMYSQPVTRLFSDAVADFYRGPSDVAPFALHGEIVFPLALDTSHRQGALRAQGGLGAYSQIAIWTALDRTPQALGDVALRVWAQSPPVDTPFEVVFPADAPGAAEPAPIDFGAGPDHPAEGVAWGRASMLHGVRVREEMVDLVTAMARRPLVPAVISASQVDLVRAVIDRHYGLKGQPLAGMLPARVSSVYGADLRAPAPYRGGKVEAARALAKALFGDEERRPVLCAGDTNTDLEMVAYSADYRLFFDRGKRPLMDLARHLLARGAGAATIVEPPFA